MAEVKLKETKQIDDVSQALQDLLDEVSKNKMDKDTKSNPVDSRPIGKWITLKR